MKKTIAAGKSGWILFLVVLALPAACGFAKNLDQQLIAAAKRGDAAQVEHLLERGAAVNAREVNGQLTRMRYTALMWASYKGHGNVVKVLLACGADEFRPGNPRIRRRSRDRPVQCPLADKPSITPQVCPVPAREG